MADIPGDTGIGLDIRNIGSETDSIEIFGRQNIGSVVISSSSSNILNSSAID